MNIIAVLAISAAAATPQTLPSIIATAKSGDRIVLAKGTFPLVTITGAPHARPVEIDARKATVRGLVIRGTAGWIWNGGRIISPYTQARGIFIDGSRDITIKGVTVTGAQIGALVYRGSSKVELSRNNFDGIGHDGINVAWANDVRIIDNVCKNFRPVHAIYSPTGKVVKDGDHPDCIQLWSVAGKPTTSYILIEGNNARGDMQGITFFWHKGQNGLSNIIIRNNHLVLRYWHGITMDKVNNLQVTGNVVRTELGAKALNPPFHPIKTWVKTSGSDLKVCGNIVPAFPDAASTKPCSEVARQNWTR